MGWQLHWAYKEGKTSKVDEEDSINKQMTWFRDLVELQDDAKDASEFMDFVKEDLFKDQVYVFTPNGEVMELPTGSGPIDFAYHIHSEIGNKTIGAKVNGRIVALDYKLKNGDIVNILTNSNSNGPSRDWLKFTNTSKARNRIKRFFKLQDLEENSELGESILEKELKETGHSLKVLNNKKVEASLLERFNFNTLTDLFASIGLGEVSVSIVINSLNLKKKKLKKKCLIMTQLFQKRLRNHATAKEPSIESSAYS